MRDDTSSLYLRVHPRLHALATERLSVDTSRMADSIRLEEAPQKAIVIII